jgi:S-adenosylmethionine:tRNA ribosyltransferase-isomerase
LKTSDFDYQLPAEYIAQTPLEPRDLSRLMVLDRESGKVQHAVFHEIGQFLGPGDLLVLNDTRVISGRLFANKIPGGGKVELLLLRQEDEYSWEVLVGGKRLTPGRELKVQGGPAAEVVSSLGGPRRLVRFFEPIEPFLSEIGHVPLPPYIKEPLADPERYQTVFARQPGSAAAPTAGLHFTRELFDSLVRRGVNITSVLLHVGLDTFAPVTEADPSEHIIHSEWCRITPDAVQIINRTRRAGGRIIAVGTTSVRVLESAAQYAPEGELVAEFEGPTDLFILPGYQFKVVDALLTNFHLPRSTLIMLVSAFAGRETILGSYELAKKVGYRFYSFGDAMLIL